MIDKLDLIKHDGCTVYRLEMVLMRPRDVEFRLPVFVSKHVLDGYVPQRGEGVEGVLWLQSRLVEQPTEPRIAVGRAS